MVAFQFLILILEKTLEKPPAGDETMTKRWLPPSRRDTEVWEWPCVEWGEGHLLCGAPLSLPPAQQRVRTAPLSDLLLPLVRFWL